MSQSEVFVVSTVNYCRLRSFKIVYHRSRSFFLNFFADKSNSNLELIFLFERSDKSLFFSVLSAEKLIKSHSEFFKYYKVYNT